MARYAAFLRGVSPMNLKMPQLKEYCELAGFTNVKTLLSSGNVVFDSKTTTDAAVERKVEAAMQEHLGRTVGHSEEVRRGVSKAAGQARNDTFGAELITPPPRHTSPS